jgi:hypothetical protein
MVGRRRRQKPLPYLGRSVPQETDVATYPAGTDIGLKTRRHFRALLANEGLVLGVGFIPHRFRS